MHTGETVATDGCSEGNGGAMYFGLDPGRPGPSRIAFWAPSTEAGESRQGHIGNEAEEHHKPDVAV